MSGYRVQEAREWFSSNRHPDTPLIPDS